VSDDHVHDAECAVAHGDAAALPRPDRHLLAVYASPVAHFLLRWGRELGFTTALLEPDPDRVSDDLRSVSGRIHHDPTDVEVAATTDVVVTDHHRDDLGPVMVPLLTGRSMPRWIGIMGSPRHVGPHVAALAAEGLAEEVIATVHRPIGLDIGSKEPAEIALATLAGLLADRNGRSGAFHRAAVPSEA
jgi:xanthine dehydrogenase accessory factor